MPLNDEPDTPLLVEEGDPGANIWILVEEVKPGSFVEPAILLEEAKTRSLVERQGTDPR